MPKPLLYEKYSHMLALIELDKIFDIKSIWGITKEVSETFPDVVDKIIQNQFEVRSHFHVKKKELGKGKWVPPLEVNPENMIYDRKYVLNKKKILPKNGEIVVWHVDHPYNLPYYIEFVQRCKKEGML